MHNKHKVVKRNLVHDKHNIAEWDDLIALAGRHILLAQIRQEELTQAIQLYRQKRDAGIPFPIASNRQRRN